MSASLRMMCTLQRLLKSLVVFLGGRLMSPILLSRSYRLTVQHKLAAQTLNSTCTGTLTGQGSDRGLSHTHEHSTQTCVCVVHVVMCPAVFMIVFRKRSCHVHVSRKEGTACITSLASPLATRRQALRIKTGSKLGQHVMIPLSGLKQHPCWVTEEGSRVGADWYHGGIWG